MLGFTFTMKSFRKRADSAFSPDDKVLREKIVKKNFEYLCSNKKNSDHHYNDNNLMASNQLKF